MKNTSYEEMLIMINGVLLSNIVSEMIDGGYEEVEFHPNECKELKINLEGEVFTKDVNSVVWKVRCKEESEKLRFGNNKPKLVKDIMLAFAKEVVRLKEENRVIKKAIKEVRAMGALTIIYEKELIIEKIEQ